MTTMVQHWKVAKEYKIQQLEVNRVPNTKIFLIKSAEQKKKNHWYLHKWCNTEMFTFFKSHGDILRQYGFNFLSQFIPNFLHSAVSRINISQIKNVWALHIHHLDVWGWCFNI